MIANGLWGWEGEAGGEFLEELMPDPSLKGVMEKGGNVGERGMHALGQGIYSWQMEPREQKHRGKGSVAYEEL